VELMRILARQRFDPRATYDITAPDGAKIGEIQKVFGASLLRSSYEIRNSSVTVRAREQSLPVALIRRFIGFIPFIGGFTDWLPIPYNFEFLVDGRRVGINQRRFGSFRDVYDIDLSDDPERTIDRRLILAAAVGMDALQAR
jgi:uncharacterized protein YxjI